MEEGYGLRLPFLLAAFPTAVGVSTPWCLLMHPVTLSLTDCGGYAGEVGQKDPPTPQTMVKHVEQSW